MSQILSLFGYDTFNLEVNIYAMAEDVYDITDLMKSAETLKRLVLNPWEMIMHIWAAFLSIAVVVFLVGLVMNEKAKWRNQSRKKEDAQLGADPVPVHTEDVVKEQKNDRQSEEDEKTIHPDADPDPVKPDS
ncbi:PREDICTED: uncharacterized protein LOC108610050 [Drosophila arizonae]|uniref:Uncharacterized protein LOC108610050 n=1 Tax=Drosophila arizonae TaxID=7263 RepID=A0ABM1NQY4_DROAR|nr:PREDICTED: uncharacterized protein LOC108610050 [Drosophila arizonae]